MFFVTGNCFTTNTYYVWDTIFSVHGGVNYEQKGIWLQGHISNIFQNPSCLRVLSTCFTPTPLAGWPITIPTKFIFDYKYFRYYLYFMYLIFINIFLKISYLSILTQIQINQSKQISNNWEMKSKNIGRLGFALPFI